MGTNWSDATKTEFKQINDYETFRVLENDEPMPPGTNAYRTTASMMLNSKTKMQIGLQEVIGQILPKRTFTPSCVHGKQSALALS
jgi:hypothetical protein